MTLPIISAQQRMAERKGVKLLMLGKSGIGKTSRLQDLDPTTTLFLDIEAGDLAVADWPGDTIRPASWPESRDFFVFLAGPDKSLPPEAAFSQAHYDHVIEKFGDAAQLDRYQTFFLDSITQLSRQCFAWCKTQPGAVSDRSGKPDLRAAYGLLGQEMIGALTHLQHARGKNVVFVAILDERLDDYNRKVFVPQIEGSKTSLELPGIVDEVVTLAEIKAQNADGSDSTYRAFVTHTLNPYGFPAKDRSGRLDLLEPPHLGALIAKCAGTPVPASAATPNTTESKE
ncbi:ATP-binding protein [Pseudomonas nitroreducens]|uniref:ATP-binding protein n=1 Tax=Pseudomonas nitroreducens TaxID=46680 RepID=A0ABS0KDH9_PSENT|nr:ATP-binding protein [Pseudomonas nitroreducens]MBG6286121.1 ATP-binding protein [Pseudomonas nitroreducens]